MTPFARKSLSTCSALLLVVGGSLLVPAAALGAEAPTPLPMPAATATATPAPAATDEPSATDQPAADDEVAVQDADAPAAPPVDAPAPTPSVVPTPGPTPQAEPALPPVPFELISPDFEGWNGPIIGDREFDVTGTAAPTTIVTITDGNGVLLARTSAGTTSRWKAHIVYADDAYTNQTVIITAQAVGYSDVRYEASFELAPARLADVVMTTPAPSSSFSGSGTLVDVTFTGTGIPGSLVSVYGFPFAGIRLDDLDGHHLPEIGTTAPVAADGSWSTTMSLEPGDYSFSASQSQAAPEGSPYYPFYGASDSIEYRDIFVVSTAQASGGQGTLPETGSSDAGLGALAAAFLVAGVGGMLASRVRSRGKRA